MVRRRLRILTLLIALPFCVAFVRLAALQLVPSSHQASLDQSRHLSIVPAAPKRGRILARGGEVLAEDVPVFDIEFDYSKVNPRDRLVAILADELGEAFGSFHDRERIDERILELARPEELATRPEPPAVLKIVQEEQDDSAAANEGTRDAREWIFLIGPIHQDAMRRIVERWRKSNVPSASFLEFRPAARKGYFDLWFSRRDIVRQEIVFLRLASQLANGDSSRWKAEYQRLIDRAREVRAGYESRVRSFVGAAPTPASPPTKADERAYRRWKDRADARRTFYHRQERHLVRDVSLDVVSAVEMYPASFLGLSSRSRSRRVYPQNEVCGSFLGQLGLLGSEKLTSLREARLLVQQYFTDHKDLKTFEEDRSALVGARESRGRGGLELYYDRKLRGLYGGVAIEAGRILHEVPAVDGEDIRTTIDLPLERLIHEELMRVSSGTSERAGNAASAVVMDVSTGALLACAGVPSVDPNRLREPGYDKELEARWGTQTTGWLVDRPTRARLFPGSVFKVVVAAAALETAGETGFSPRATSYPCNYRFPHFKIHCNAKNGHGLERVNLVQALKYSCNNYFFSIGYLMLQPSRIAVWADRFGFGSSPGIDLPGGGNAGRMSPVDKIENVGVCHFSIGQVHVEATPLQVARSLGVIATGGDLLRPFLVQPTTPEPVAFENPHTVELINDGLWRAAHEAGGTAAKVEFGLREFRVALKTGTAEVTKGKETVNNAWLAGYAPAGPSSGPRARPRIAFAVVVEETRGHGADVCAPVVRRLLEHFAASDPEAYTLDGQAAGD